jgi:AbiU2
VVWNSTLHGVQLASVIAIRRIFDDSRDARSARYLLDYAADHYKIFSQQALASRKGPEFATDAYEAKQMDFNALNTQLAQHAMLFAQTIGPLRDKAFAHSSRMAHDQIESLFGSVRIDEYQRLAVFGIRSTTHFFTSTTTANPCAAGRALRRSGHCGRNHRGTADSDGARVHRQGDPRVPGPVSTLTPRVMLRPMSAQNLPFVRNTLISRKLTVEAQLRAWSVGRMLV